MDNFAITAADAVSRRYKSNDPEAIIAQRAIKIKDIRFCEELLGFYTVLLNCEYIGINPNCSKQQRRSALAHELGHAIFDRKHAASGQAFQDTYFYSLSNAKAERRANTFAAELLLSDDDVLKPIGFYLLWDHKPLTDFWMTGPGTVKRLEKHGIHTMGELAYFSTVNQDILYKEFGVDAELLIDHAWGLEPCGMKEIKAYKPSTNSISEGQVLSCPYPYDKSRIIVMEMADSLVLQLTDKGLVTDSLTLDVGYDRENCDSGKYRGPVHIDHYGRTVPKGAHGSTKLDNPTNLGSILISATTELFERIADKTLTVRRITIAANRVVKDEGFFQVDLFTDTTKLEKEKKLQNAMLGLKKKFGKNAVLKGTNYLDGATMRERNQQIGGHKAK